MTKAQTNDMRTRTSLHYGWLRAFHLGCTTISASFTFACVIVLDEQVLALLSRHFHYVPALVEILLVFSMAFGGGNFATFIALSLGVPSFKESRD